MGYYDFPHTRNYDTDLGYLIKQYLNLREEVNNLIASQTIVYADPLQWSIDKQYRVNTIVINGYNAYLSKQPVPLGIEITNTDYWLVVGDFIREFDDIRANITNANNGIEPRLQIARNQGDLLWWNDQLYQCITDIEKGTLLVEDTNVKVITIEDFINAKQSQMKTYVNNVITNEQNARVNSDNSLSNRIDTEVNNREIADTNLGTRIDNIISQSGTSSTEVVDARNNTNTGTTYSSLHDRLDTENNHLRKDLYNLSESGNFFDVNTIIKDKGITSDRGTIVDASGSYISQKIYMDFTKQVIANGTSYSGINDFLYCYTAENTYLGRIAAHNGVIIADSYPTVSYVLYPGKLTDKNVVLKYGSDNTYIKYLPIEGYIETSPYVNNLKDKIESTDVTNFAKNGNYYNETTSLQNISINSGTGELRDSDLAKTSAKIIMDFTKQIIASGSTYSNDSNWLYCYEKNDHYLGRISAKDSVVISDTYPTTYYVRFCLLKDDNYGTVTYGNYAPYSPYNPLGEWINEYINPIKIRIGQYNMGNFAGKNMETASDEVASAMIKVISEVNPDIWGLQYDVQYFNSKDIQDVLFKLKQYYVSNYTGSYNGKAISSNVLISNAKQINYTYSGNISHPWFYSADMFIYGKSIKLIVLHVDWRDKYVRKSQLTQIKEYADQFKYCIIIGDFNPDDYIDGVKQSNNLTTEEDLAIFTSDNKYTTANAGFFGNFNTILNKGDVGMWNGDNILVSSNIVINNVNRVIADYMNDHAIIYADITIY